MIIIEVIDGIAIEGFIASVNIGASASSQLRAVGNVGAVTWSIDSGALPPDWTLGASTGLVSGSADDAGSYSVTIRATDSGGRFTRRLFVFRVQALPLQLAGTFGPFEVGTPFVAVLTGSGGLPPYSLVAVTLPTSIGAAVDGADIDITGTPSVGYGIPAGTTGTFSASVTIEDSEGTQVTWSQDVDYEVPAIVITGAPLSDATVGVAYSDTLTVSGGVPPYTMPVFADQPTGISGSITSPTITISGTPGVGTDAGSPYTLDIEVEDAEGNTQSAAPSLVVDQIGYDDEILADSPWGYWKLNETGTLTTAADSSGNGNHGTFSGSNMAAAAPLFSGSTGCINWSVSGGRINLPTDTRAANAPFTVVCSIVSTPSGLMQIVSADSGSSPGRAVQFRKSAADLEGILILPSVVTLNVSTSMNSATPSIIAVVYDPSVSDAAGKLKLYRNGVEVDRTTTSISNNQTSYPWAIAARHNGLTGDFSGSLEKVGIFHTALSAARLLAHYNARNIL